MDTGWLCRRCENVSKSLTVLPLFQVTGDNDAPSSDFINMIRDPLNNTAIEVHEVFMPIRRPREFIKGMAVP